MKDMSAYHKQVAAWAPLAVRVALGVIFMAHGSQKLFGAFGGRGIEGTIGIARKIGFEPAVAWGWILALTEFFGGLAILVGMLTQVASLLIIITMLVAIVKVHIKGGFFAPQGIEYNVALIGMALSLVVSGGGKLSLDGLLRRRK